ncbi:MAG: M56 family metallopeptidase [Bacteroidetes bacterium]|nr:M56 family metallopeptidase [Bacteroidota bacterium]
MNQHSLIQIFGIALLHSIWQMALLWIFYKTFTNIFIKLKSSTKATIAATFIIAGFGWFIYTFVSLMFFSLQNENYSALFITQSIQADSIVAKIIYFGSIIYFALLFFPILNFIKNIQYIKQIRNTDLLKVDFSFRLFASRTAVAMGIKRNINIRFSKLIKSPLTVGFYKPLILLPLAVINQLTTQQIEAVLLHELAHIKRYDYLINICVQFVNTILYFNPFVKFLCRELELEREKSCDELVLQFEYNAYHYASALLTIGKNMTTPNSLSLPAVNKRSLLLQRVELILDKKTKSVFSVSKLLSFMAGIFCLLFLNIYINTENKTNSSRQKSITNFSNLSPIPEDILFASANVDKPISEINSFAYSKPNKTSTVKNLTSKTIPSENELTPNSKKLDYINVAYTERAGKPELNKHQEQQVQDVVAKSKSLVEQFEWNQIEAQVADVLTENEKEELKTVYKNELEKLDWNKLENKLRADYAQIDWDNINEKFDKSTLLNRADSMLKLYTNSVATLNEVKKQITPYKMNDNYKSLILTLEHKKQEYIKAIDFINAIKKGKVVHL